MAGSWQHMTTKSGKLRNNETFCGMIENLGDAYEAAGECYGMVQWLAAELARGSTAVSRKQWIEFAEQRYEDGLRIGGIQKAR